MVGVQDDANVRRTRFGVAMIEGDPATPEGISHVDPIKNAAKEAWQDIIGFELHWMVLAMSVILLLAGGSDYNLLLVPDSKRRSMPASRPASSARWPVPGRW